MLSDGMAELLARMLEEHERQRIMTMVIGYLLHKNGGSVTINFDEYNEMFKELENNHVIFLDGKDSCTIKFDDARPSIHMESASERRN